MTSRLFPAPNVVPLWQGQKEAMSAILARVHGAWSSLRAGGAVPSRAALRPGLLGSALSRAFVVERVRTGTLRFRVAGQHLSTFMGMDVRGMPLRAFFEIPDRKFLMESAEQVFAGPAALTLHAVSDTQRTAVLQAQFLLLPMTGSGGEVDCALGVLATDGPIGFPPRRFRIRRATLTSCDRPGLRPRGATAGAATAPQRCRGGPGLTVLDGGRV